MTRQELEEALDAGLLEGNVEGNRWVPLRRRGKTIVKAKKAFIPVKWEGKASNFKGVGVMDITEAVMNNGTFRIKELPKAPSYGDDTAVEGEQ